MTNISDVMPFEEFSRLVDELRVPTKAVMEQFTNRKDVIPEARSFVLLTVACEMASVAMYARHIEGATEKETFDITLQLLRKCYDHLQESVRHVIPHVGGMQ